MNRKTQYAINGALIGGVGTAIVDILLQWMEHKESGTPFNWESFNGKRTLKRSLIGASIGGATGFTIGAIVDDANSNTNAINTDAYLNLFAARVQSDKNSSLYRISERKCEQIIKFLEKEFASELSYVPFQWGSNAKGTAIEGKSDFDIMVRFHRDSFTVEEMYFTVLDAFKESFYDNSIVEVIDQKKSIGLLFLLKGENVRIDVVPMRDIGTDPKNTASNLYVNNKGLFSKPTITKTDIPLQASIKLTPTQKKLIIMLKKWKTDNEVPISSYMIQLFVKKAYEKNKNRIPRKLTAKLILILEFIAENISSIKLISPENTNNIVSDIPITDKETIRKKAIKVVEEYEYHPNSIKLFFILQN
ncbi:MAG TPA: nucleotidyltransferase [Bacteroidia bacterium]|nr:nucleotidyltransferase [Bacteroidia bacterium]HRH08153.1 nucleotidyltransferase [Bacteroidia bacterium]